MAEMSISFKKATRQTSLRHNNREKEVEHADPNREKDNVYLRKEKIQDVYEREFGEALEKYNKKQKRNDRKIDNYYSHIRQSKKHEPQYEFIAQVGQMEDYQGENSKEKWQQAKELLQNWFEGFEKDNPSLVVYNAVIHMDEQTPHMHINAVPVATGYTNGLERQVSFDRALKNQEIAGRSSRDRFQTWRDSQIQRMEKLMNERGIERKEVGTNNIENYHEYKKAMRALDGLREKHESISTEYEQIKSDYERLEENIDKNPQKHQKLLEGKSGLFKNKLTFTPEEIAEANEKYREMTTSRNRQKHQANTWEEKYQKLEKSSEAKYARLEAKYVVLEEEYEEQSKLLQKAQKVIKNVRQYLEDKLRINIKDIWYYNRHAGRTKEREQEQPKAARQPKEPDGPSL